MKLRLNVIIFNNRFISSFQLPDFIIFAGMKKSCISIFLLSCFLFAFVNADFFSIQKNGADSPVVQKLSAYAQTDFNPLNAEIEHANIHGYTVLSAHAGPQKTPGYLTVTTKSVAIVSGFPTGFPEVQLFDNSYLSYNYPTPSFW